MDKIMAMREKRAEMWEQAKQFLDSHEKDGRLTAENARAYEQMESDVLAVCKHFAFHLENYLIEQFGKALGNAEEATGRTSRKAFLPRQRPLSPRR